MRQDRIIQASIFDGDYIPESQFPLAPHPKPCYNGVTI